MYIRDLYEEGKTVLSLEVFPPNKDSSIETVLDILEHVTQTSPDFVSVTYGASGNSETTRYSQIIAGAVKNLYDTESLFHLTCVNNKQDQIIDIIDRLKKLNIKNILALRGDMPETGQIEESDFLHASDLIKVIKKHSDFCVGAACYPEGHIDEGIPDNNIRALKEKQDLGADFFISQLFFDNKYFLDFRDKASKSGVVKPIAAGIMPILSKSQVERMIFMCGVSLPGDIVKILHRHADNPDDLKNAGVEYALNQAEELIKEGVSGIHLYTMNQPAIAQKVMTRLGARSFD